MENKYPYVTLHERVSNQLNRYLFDEEKQQLLEDLNITEAEIATFCEKDLSLLLDNIDIWKYNHSDWLDHNRDI